MERDSNKASQLTPANEVHLLRSYYIYSNIFFFLTRTPLDTPSDAEEEENEEKEDDKGHEISSSNKTVLGMWFFFKLRMRLLSRMLSMTLKCSKFNMI